MLHAMPYLAVTAASSIGLAAAATDPVGVAPYVGGGAGVIAVMALGEVTRRLLNGRLIPRETRDMEAEQSAAIIAGAQREDRLMKVVEDGQKQNEVIAAAVKTATTKAAFDLAEVHARQTAATAAEIKALTRAVQDLHDEVRKNRRENT